jgi:hypothetical protein
MNKYYELIAETEEGKTEVQFGSFIKSEVAFEKDAEKDNLKQLGYRNTRIVTRVVDETPDPEIYAESQYMKVICKSLKDNDIRIAVGDLNEGFYDLEPCRDIEEIKDAIEATEMPVVYIFKNGHFKGNMLVIIDDDPETTIADHTANEYMESLIES